MAERDQNASMISTLPKEAIERHNAEVKDKFGKAWAALGDSNYSAANRRAIFKAIAVLTGFGETEFSLDGNPIAPKI